MLTLLVSDLPRSIWFSVDVSGAVAVFLDTTQPVELSPCWPAAAAAFEFYLPQRLHRNLLVDACCLPFVELRAHFNSFLQSQWVGVRWSSRLTFTPNRNPTLFKPKALNIWKNPSGRIRLVHKIRRHFIHLAWRGCSQGAIRSSLLTFTNWCIVVMWGSCSTSWTYQRTKPPKDICVIELSAGGWHRTT